MMTNPWIHVEEEVPYDPPLEPTNSFLFSASDILTLPLTYSHHSLKGDFTLDLGSCPVEEEIPTMKKKKRLHLLAIFNHQQHYPWLTQHMELLRGAFAIKF
jgi:hypothetical protein